MTTVFVGKLIALGKNDYYTFTISNNRGKKTFSTSAPDSMMVLDYVSIGDTIGVEYYTESEVVRSVWDVK